MALELACLNINCRGLHWILELCQHWAGHRDYGDKMPGTRQADAAPSFVMQRSLVDKFSNRASPVLLIRSGTSFASTLSSMPRQPADSSGLIVES